MDPQASSSTSPVPRPRGRPRKYHTEEERNAAKLESRRRKLQEMRDADPERYRELLRQKNQREAERFRASRRLADEALAEGGARLQAPEVVAALEHVERVRTQRRSHFKKYYHTHPEFRERHLEKVAAYDRAKAAEKKAMCLSK